MKCGNGHSFDDSGTNCPDCAYEEGERSAQEEISKLNLQNDELRKVAGQAVNWLHAVAPLHARAPEIRELADRLYDVAKLGHDARHADKRVCPICKGETGPGDPRCMQCIYDAGKERQRKDDDHRAAWKGI